MLKPLPIQRGMTIVEIMISLAVLGILLMVALPNFAAWLQNLQLAVGPGTGWTVSEAASGAVIQSKVHAEGSANAVVAITPGGSTLVTFTPLGGVGANSDASAAVTQLDFTNPTGGSCQPSGPMRCLRVVVTGGGSVKMCDPALASTDPRGCP